jgi:uncharacterized CHY-type Zn-finger protein
MSKWHISYGHRVVDENGDGVWCGVCAKPITAEEFTHDEGAVCEHCEEPMHKACGEEHGANEWYCDNCVEKLGDTIDGEAKT